METKSASMLWALIGRLADNCLTFRISGEPGVGKEAIAHLIYRHYPHKNSKFVKLNCRELREGTNSSEIAGTESLSIARLVSVLEAPENLGIFFEDLQLLPEKFQLRLQQILIQFF